MPVSTSIVGLYWTQEVQHRLLSGTVTKGKAIRNICSWVACSKMDQFRIGLDSECGQAPVLNWFRAKKSSAQPSIFFLFRSNKREHHSFTATDVFACFNIGQPNKPTNKAWWITAYYWCHQRTYHYCAWARMAWGPSSGGCVKEWGLQSHQNNGGG